MRVVPRENEAINETWIADRDRFGFEGIYGATRVSEPMLRVDGVLTEVDWETALAAAAEGLAQVARESDGAQLGFLASPSATTEELYLLARIARGLGCPNIDHRLRQLDFRAQDRDPPFPGLAFGIADVERLQGLLIVGSNLRYEMPLLAHRIRKAAVKGGAQVAFLNPARFDYLFPVAAYGVAREDFVAELAAVVRAAALAAGRPVPAGVPEATVGDTHRALAAAVATGERRAIVLGTLAQRHPAYAELQFLCAILGELTNASVGCLTEGANAAGAYLAGAAPHRLPGGDVVAGQGGLPARAMLAARLKAYVLLGAIDPALDLSGDAEALGSAEFVVAVTSHLPENLKANVRVVLPIGSFAETSGTFVNIEGQWQSWQGAAKVQGAGRPGWKVLRVLGNLLNLPDMDYATSEEVRAALRALCADRASPRPPGVAGRWEAAPGADSSARAAPWIDVPPYQGDALVRGSGSLSKTKDGQVARVAF
jgi:NADH-quinone oxidoreductase subunit G